MMTFAVGGLQVWMPTFLMRMRGVSLDHANTVFGGLTVVAGTVATLFGGWLGDRLLRRTPLGLSVDISDRNVAVHPGDAGRAVCSGHNHVSSQSLWANFFILLNTAPLNAALVNSVSARIRATAVAVNVFTIHLLGDAFSPTLIGAISDKTNLRTGFMAAVVAAGISAAVLFYGMRFAPQLPGSELEGDIMPEGASA